MLNADQFQSRRQWLDAEERLKQQLIADPENADACRQLGEVYYRQGQYFAARQQLTRCLKLTPNDATAHYLLARLLRETGNDRESLRQAEAAIAANPNLADGYALKGRLLLDSGRNKEAMEAFAQGWRQRPPSVAAGVELAQWDAQRHDDESAADRLRLCLVHDPRHAIARQFYAETLDRLGRSAESARQYEALVNSGDAGADAYYRLARLYHQLGKSDLAQANFNHAVRLAPADPNAEMLKQQLASRPAVRPAPDEYRPLLSAKP